MFNGGIYEGDIIDNQPEGEGKWNKKEGEIESYLHGTFVAGVMKNGKGKFTYDTGIYEGSVQNGLPGGTGKWVKK